MKEEKEVAGVEVDNKTEATIELKKNETVEKIISFETLNIKLTQVKLMDDTDFHNELTQRNEWLLQQSERNLTLDGNLFIIQESFSRKGKICIKKTALPHARPTKAIDGDLKVNFFDTGWNFFMMGNANEKVNTWEILEFEGGQIEITKTLHAWQANQRPNTLGHKTPLFLSNTWGDRSRDGCISEVFIKKEIDGSLKLGVDIVQIDDGWQKGVSSNSVLAKEKNGRWEGFWASDPDFWTANLERLPNGLEPIIEYAREKNVKIGLWFAPDSFDEFANWQKDTDFIIETYEKFGVENFKLDSIKAETEIGNQNLQNFFSSVNEKSNGQVVFDLDITAGTRPGYFGALQVGPLFIENRYTDWGNYWPHQTLRNLWQLSNWIDPKRLRMEFLNNTRNPNMYKGSPIAPIKYPPATLFATIMFSNPLGWFEISNLPEDYIAQVAPLVQIWKEHREEMFAKPILPIGNIPDGIEYTGFLAGPSADERNGYILIFREFNAANSYELDLSKFNCEPTSIDILFGNGCIEIANGKLQVQIDNKLEFIFAKINS